MLAKPSCLKHDLVAWNMRNLVVKWLVLREFGSGKKVMRMVKVLSEVLIKLDREEGREDIAEV